MFTLIIGRGYSHSGLIVASYDGWVLHKIPLSMFCVP